ncbi:hypothetical protein M2145_002858 [Lachnospiraceae bacterium PF1-21]|uniref:PBECR2 nuclease fold domain-containing protein n=1 Tax=Ohessyouella blattaphilus TaxID=2949333 RepID=A0ABT1EM54_9FIRM|nr:PBECR2 nuclease fold domain-containing protein [Ohessyouella blattaphilus]MCP1111606.1 PBECR2 nuclease fold domain-containing protein [Ohessyouella blattaphilus]MCR8565000.1 PBECR2 nuclease fold domain-containing protein [Ohessyouella blattaphilus]
MNILDLIKSNTKCLSLGTLPDDLIAFVTDKDPQIGSLLAKKKDILFWKDRLQHIELHKDDFFSDALYLTCLEDIPDIICQPDYVSIHPKRNSISFIKTYTQNISVAVRITTDGRLAVRTMYPITDAQLSDYLIKKRAWEYPKEI